MTIIRDRETGRPYPIRMLGGPPEIKVVKRTQGRSSVAAAAYRNGKRLRDERTGETHDYRRKKGVDHSAIVGWRGSSESLWNAAETHCENRRNSQTAREMILPLPADIPEEARRRITLGVALWLRDEYGVAVEISHHAPHRFRDVQTTPSNTEEDQELRHNRNYHAHLLFTRRQVIRESDGAEALGSLVRCIDENKKTATQSEIRAAGVILPAHKKTISVGGLHVMRMRKEVEKRINAELARAGTPYRYTTDSYIELKRNGLLPPGAEPTRKLGPALTVVKRHHEWVEAQTKEHGKAVPPTPNFLKRHRASMAWNEAAWLGARLMNSILDEEIHLDEVDRAVARAQAKQTMLLRRRFSVFTTAALICLLNLGHAPAQASSRKSSHLPRAHEQEELTRTTKMAIAAQKAAKRKSKTKTRIRGR